MPLRKRQKRTHNRENKTTVNDLQEGSSVSVATDPHSLCPKDARSTLTQNAQPNCNGGPISLKGNGHGQFLCPPFKQKTNLSSHHWSQSRHDYQPPQRDHPCHHENAARRRRSLHCDMSWIDGPAILPSPQITIPSTDLSLSSRSPRAT
jgi:ribosomal protein L32